MNKQMLWRVFGAVLNVALVTNPLPGQTLTTLATFTGQNGAYPGYGPLVQGTDGLLYGVAQAGGANGAGVIYRIMTGGTMTIVYSFCSKPNCADGQSPWGGLTQAADDNLYGTTAAGGASGQGTIFKLTLTGTLTTMHSFDGTDGSSPYGGLIQAADGNLYGTASAGGSNNYGTIFRIAPSGTFTVLHDFAGTDGANPWAGLIQTNFGSFYGTTFGGGANGAGTVFRMSPDGFLETLHSFNGSDGANPADALVQANDGIFYGTTVDGGPGGHPCPCFGTVFQVAPNGTFTHLVGFYAGGGTGTWPYASLIQATDGSLYGTTWGYPGYPPLATSGGTVYALSPGSRVTTVYSFGNDYGVGNPTAALVQATDGNFYGTTNPPFTFVNDGTVFRLSVGLGPFVKTLPASGTVGKIIRILGTDLTGATEVAFNGVRAEFTAARPTEILATVPDGAVTGRVQVTTPRGVLSTGADFFVRY